MGRLARTILLGTVAAGAAIWWLARAYDVESTTLAGFLVSSGALVGLSIAAAVVGGIALGWWRNRRRNTSFDAFRGPASSGPAGRPKPTDPSDP